MQPDVHVSVRVGDRVLDVLVRFCRMCKKPFAPANSHQSFCCPGCRVNFNNNFGRYHLKGE